VHPPYGMQPYASRLKGVLSHTRSAALTRSYRESPRDEPGLRLATQRLLQMGVMQSRLRGHADVKHFPAACRRVALAQGGRRRVAESECELLSDVQQQILPRLSSSLRRSCGFRLRSPRVPARTRRCWLSTRAIRSLPHTECGHCCLQLVRAIFVAAASSQYPEIHRNLAATRRMENRPSAGSSAEKSANPLDRRVSVAPMMDWSD